MKTQLLAFALLLRCTVAFSKNDKLIKIILHTPSKLSKRSMMFVNKDIGPNIWVEEGGDLMFYISKTDAFNGISRLLKLGRIRFKLTPNPFLKG